MTENRRTLQRKGRVKRTRSPCLQEYGSCISRWCFQIFVIFYPILGEMIQFDLRIFFNWLGWFNHQPEDFTTFPLPSFLKKPRSDWGSPSSCVVGRSKGEIPWDGVGQHWWNWTKKPEWIADIEPKKYIFWVVFTTAGLWDIFLTYFFWIFICRCAYVLIGATWRRWSLLWFCTLSAWWHLVIASTWSVVLGQADMSAPKLKCLYHTWTLPLAPQKIIFYCRYSTQPWFTSIGCT